MPTPLAMPGDGSRVVCGPAGDPDPVGPGRPRDRHTRASRLKVVDLEACPCHPDPPAPSTPAAPGVLKGLAHRLHARPGTPVPQVVALSLVVGVVQHEELTVGVSPACRTPNGALPPERCW